MAMATPRKLPHGTTMSLSLLRVYREKFELSQEAVAEATGLSVSQISRFESGKRDPKLSDLENLAALFKISVGQLLGEAVSLRIPVLSSVSAGRLWGQDGVYGHNALRHISVTDLPPGDWFALEVKGDSMDRVAPEGSIIVVNTRDDRLIDDRFYVFATPSGDSTFKRYRSKPERLLPYSFNPDHERIDPEGDILVIGRVYRVIHDLR